MTTTFEDPVLALALRRELLRLARVEDDLASAEAAATPYWSATPTTVLGHRTAAELLRADADQFLAVC